MSTITSNCRSRRKSDGYTIVNLPEAGQAGSPRGGPACRIIGIDPGLASVGYGIIDIVDGGMRTVDFGCLVTTPDDPLAERLGIIHDGLRDLLVANAPETGGMESLFFFRNVSSALPVAEVRGVIRLVFRSCRVPLEDYTPNAIKSAVTGSARADKTQVQEMVRRLLQLPGLRRRPEPDHAADALAAAICRWHHMGVLSTPATGRRSH